MSISGFKIDGVVEKYNYSDLDNKDVQTADIHNKAVTSAKLGDDVTTILDNKANIDGSYSDLTAGLAKQLESSVGIDDSTPYNFRTSGGSVDIGDRERVDAVVGGTIAWNQLIVNGNFANANNWTGYGATISVADGILKATATGANTYAAVTNTRSNISATLNHKILMCATLRSNTALTNNCDFAIHVGNYQQQSSKFSLSANTWTKISKIINVNSNAAAGTQNMQFQFWTPHTGAAAGIEVEYSDVVAFDLTQMFGSTIADYIYNLEQTTTGAGVAYFRKLFPKPYYEYNAGELMSVKASAHKMTGFNQWDEQSESGYYDTENNGSKAASSNWKRCKNLIPCVPNTTYYFYTDYSGSQGFGALIYYDGNGNQIGYKASNVANHTFTTPDNCRYLSFYVKPAWFDNHICINLHWDGERDGEYEPYQEWNYPLDSDLELRGIPKLDANNKLYYDGDTYESDGSDGTVTRKYGIVDLGTLSWSYSAASGTQLQRFNTSDIASLVKKEGTVFLGVVCPKYIAVSDPVYSRAIDKAMCILSSNGMLYIVDSAYTSAADFKTAMSGVYLVYELATPTTESADAYQQTQNVSDWGTEEYVDSRTVPIPVGHNTFYQANLKAKLEMMPDSPDGAGDYIMRSDGSEQTWVPLTEVKELPDAPTTDGTYVLKCTVADGTATISWISE